MKVNLTTISVRAQSFLEQPKFLDTTLESEFLVTLDGSDRILTVFHNSKKGEIELIFNESLAVFATNRTLNDLWKINFREIENFLRDENHLPALDDQSGNPEEILRTQKISLIAEALKTKFGSEINTLAEMLFDWRNLSLVAKNEWAGELLKLLSLELIYCDESTLTFTGLKKEVAGSDLELLIRRIFERGEILLPMKVVAV